MNYLVFAIVVKTTEAAASLDDMTLHAINKPRCDCGRKKTRIKWSEMSRCGKTAVWKTTSLAWVRGMLC